MSTTPAVPTSNVVYDGALVAFPGFEVRNYMEHPFDAPRVPDGKPRTKPPTGITLHTVHGKLGGLREGSKASARAEAYAKYQARTPRDVSWHFTIDTDGTIVQSADPVRWLAWHAGHVNGWTVGIELVQEDNGDLYADQLAVTARFVKALCQRLSIPLRFLADATGSPMRTPVKAMQSVSEGGDAQRWTGVFGHRNVTTNRGPGDPGDLVFLALLAQGFSPSVFSL